MWKIGLAGVALAVVAVPAWADGEEAARGEALMKARCFGCHSQERLVKLAAKTPEEARAARWEKFLPSHNVAGAEDRKAIIAHLLAFTRQ